MAITVPTQIRSVDPYADHRFSNTINRFNRIFTGNRNLIMPFDDQEFNLTKMTTTNSATVDGVAYSWTANQAVKIDGGIFIKDDTLVHVTNTAYLDFSANGAGNYVGNGIDYNSMNAEGAYFILIKYTYARSIPAPQASYVIAKQRSEFLNNRSRYIYLGTAHVVNDGSNYIIDEVALTDIDSGIERPNYTFTIPLVDGGDLD